MATVTPERQRRSAARSSTGCVICKARHVKCDERKPYCVQCVRFGHACRYAELPRKAEKKSASPGLVPVSRIRPAQPKPEMLALNPCCISLNPQDALYLDYFQTCVIPRLGSQGLMDFWYRTVLRESRSNEEVMLAILGVGAVARSKSCDSPATPLYLQPIRTIRPLSMIHYQKALDYYTKAIVKVRNRGNSTQPSRNFLITTLLFTVFEILQDNTEAVDILTASGIRVLKEALAQSVVTGTSGLAAMIDDESVKDAEFLLLRNTVNCVLFSPMYPHGRMAVLQTSEVVPAALPPPPHSASLDQFIAAWWRYVTAVTLWYNRVKYTIASWKAIDETKQSTLLAWLSQTKAWEAATRRRIDDEEMSEMSRKVASNLIFGVKVVVISVTCAYDSTGTSWDTHKDELAEMLRIANSILQVSRPAVSNDGGIVMYDGLLPGLLQICRESRDISIRSTSLDYCRGLVSPSSCWDIKGCYLGALALISAEEAERIENVGIPLHSRYDWTNGSWNSDYTEFHVTLTSKTYVDSLPIRQRVLKVRLEDYDLI